VKRDEGQVLHVGQIAIEGEDVTTGCCLLGSTYQHTATPREVMQRFLLAAGIAK